MTRTMHVRAHTKDDQKYILMLDEHESSPSLACDQLSEWALDDDLNFDWGDAIEYLRFVQTQVTRGKTNQCSD